MSPDNLRALLAGLHNRMINMRQYGAQALVDSAREGRLPPLTAAQGLSILRALRLPWPPNRFLFTDFVTGLLWLLHMHPHQQYLKDLLALYPKLQTGQQQWQALLLLSCLPQRDAAEAWVKLYGKRITEGQGVPVPLGVWSEKQMHPTILLPPLLQFATTNNAGLSTRLYSHIDRYLRGTTPKHNVAHQLQREYQRLQPGLLAAQKSGDVEWLWKKPYVANRYKAERLLRILGKLPLAASRSLLQQAVSQYTDARLRLAAAESLMSAGEKLGTDVILSIAANAEMRLHLYRLLTTLKRTTLFPRAYATQKMMADSDMVNWVIADAGVGPTAVELVGHKQMDDGRYYVYRFRMQGAAKPRWLAGISGPWPARGTQRHRHSKTFSKFEPIGRASVAEHIARLRLT